MALDQIANPTEGPAPVVAPRAMGMNRQQTATGATLLLMASSIASGLLGLVRQKYISFVFGAGSTTDAYNAAFNLPDMINYFLVGGVASITLVSILSRYREAGDEEGADRTLSVVLNAMLVVLGLGVIAAEFLAPFYTRHFFDMPEPATAALCTHLTRILLPGQLFFFAGGVLGSRLLVRKIFLYQALTPLIYNGGILLGGVLLTRRLGIDSLAWGVLGGAFAGSLAINAWGALRGGLRYTPILNLRHPAFIEWLRLSLPLMIGVSLTMADKWILSHYATAHAGGLTRLFTAKTLFSAPLSVIGMAAGAASLPFFSSLYTQGRLYDFNGAVNRSVSRLLAASVLATAWMTALSMPLVDFYRGGRFSLADVESTSRYFTIFALSLMLWSAQGIYARAFYAARNTMVPAVSGTIVTCVSIPVYGLLFGRIGVEGLALASDFGILLHTVALAVLLHRYRLVSLACLEFAEIGRAVAAAIAGFCGTWATVRFLPRPAGHPGDFLVIVAGTVVWAAVGGGMLVVTGSKLPRQLLRRG